MIQSILAAAGLTADEWVSIDSNQVPSHTGQKEEAMEVFLETERLLLRRFTVADVDNLVELDSDPEVMRYVTGGRATTRDEIRDEVLPAFLGYYDRYPGYGFWAVVEKATGVFLGWFHLRPAPESGRPGEPELGYRLRRSAWGKGFATEGSRALIGKAFAELGAQRVFAETMVVHTASRRVMEKAGLELVRTFHQDWPDKIDGDEYGDVEYALTRAEWERHPR
jgi:RimJ/RimL family protein N-acetyltransferase